MRRIISLFVLVFASIVLTLGFASVASADPGVTVEPVTASPEYGEITFTNGGKDAVVYYGTAKKSLTEKVSLVPNQVVTVTVDDVDTIYWQATSKSGTSPVHEEDVSFPIGAVALLILLVLLVFVALMVASTPRYY